MAEPVGYSCQNTDKTAADNSAVDNSAVAGNQVAVGNLAVADNSVAADNFAVADKIVSAALSEGIVRRWDKNQKYFLRDFRNVDKS